MSISYIEDYDMGKWVYSLKDKLWGHIINRSEECFERAEEARNAIKTTEELSKYSEKMRRDFIKNLGGIPYDKSRPLNAKTTGVIEEDGLKIEKVIFESRPNVYVTANLYIPEKRKDPCGAVLFQVGHAETGKTSGQYQRVARAICSTGLIVMVMDPVGQGERLSYFEPEEGCAVIPATTPDHQYAGEQCVLIGDNIARYFIADAMRAVDYLESRPEVDSEKIGATGSSGGGTATCHMMLLDKRIKAAAPGTFVTTRQAYLYAGGAQDSEQIWMNATKDGFDHHEFLLCFAPKPLLLLTVDTDFFPIEGADEVYGEGKRFYDMFGACDKLNMFKDKSQHCYTDNLAKEAAEFFARELNGEERTVDLKLIKSIDEKLLWCTKCGQVKTEFADSKFVFDENLERYSTIKKEKGLAEFIKEKMFFERKEEPLRLRTYSHFYECGMKVTPYMWFPQAQMPNFGLKFEKMAGGAKETVICLWDSGTDTIEPYIYKIREIVNSGKAAFVLDLSGVGKCAPHPLNSAHSEKFRYGVLDRLTKDLFFLGDSLCALRLFELYYAVKMIKESFNTKVSIKAFGLSSFYARLFGEAYPEIKTESEDGIPTYKDIIENKYYEDYNISGILLPSVGKFEM